MTVYENEQYEKTVFMYEIRASRNSCSGKYTEKGLDPNSKNVRYFCKEIKDIKLRLSK